MPSVHSPESMWEGAAPSDADLRSIQKTLWDVDPLDVQTLTEATNSGAAAAAPHEPPSELLKVYLRMRPLAPAEQEAQKDEEAFLTVENTTDVLAVAPKSSVAFKNGAKHGNEGACKYSFTKIFPPGTGQRDVFYDTALPLLQDVLLGKSALMFTYGVTNAGKTFTVQGTRDEPGLLPRALDVLFNSIDGHRLANGHMRPVCFSDVTDMSDEDFASLCTLKETIVNASTRPESTESGEDASMTDASDEHPDTTSKTSVRESDAVVLNAAASTEDEHDADDDEITGLATEERVVDDTVLMVDAECEYEVYVSYAEVYNEQVYDLLVPTAKRARREASRLGEKDGNVYIRQLRELPVASSTDALRLVVAGQRNRRVAATKSNQHSSRSHGLFTVKVIRREKASPHTAAVSQLTIVDLAGSERYKKTNAVGERIKEAGTINTSLMTLGKCLESMRSRQQDRKSHKDKSSINIVPYRDSKLTRLFKHYLEGKGGTTTAMVVNVANVNEHFDETAHVLKFSAMARQITAAPVVVSKVDTGIDRLEREIAAAYRADIEDLDTYNATLLGMLQEVKQQLYEAQREAAETEERVRNEVAEEMADQMAELEERYESALAQQTDATEAKYSKKWGVYTKSVARLPATSRTQAAAAADDAATAARVAELEAELSAAVRSAAEKQTALDGALATAAQTESELRDTIGRLEQRIARLSRDLEGTLEKANAQRLAATTASRAATLAETQKAELMSELAAAIASLEAERKVGHEVLQTVGPLEARVSELSELLKAAPSAEDYESLRAEHEALKKDSTASMQKSKLMIASLRRKVEEQQDVIRTLTEDIGSEETKNSQLRGQLVHVLEDRIESSAASTDDKPVTAATSTTASAAPAKPSASTEEPLVVIGTSTTPAATPAASRRGETEDMARSSTSRDASRYKGGSAQSSRAARRAAAVSASVAMASDTPVMRSSSSSAAYSRRQKRKSEAVDEEQNDELGDKENAAVSHPPASSSSSRSTKKSRTMRKQRGSSVLSPSKQFTQPGGGHTPTSRVSAMLTPIKRALRSRRGKKAA